MSLSLLLSLHCIQDKWPVNTELVRACLCVRVCAHASVHLCVSDRSPDSPVFVVFVVLRAPGGCAHFKGPSELWGLETWDCAAQLAPGHGFTRRMWAEQGELGWDGLPQTFAPFLKTAIRLKDLAPACQRETQPFCGYSLGSDLHLNLPSLSQLLCFLHILGAHFKLAAYVTTL